MGRKLAAVKNAPKSFDEEEEQQAGRLSLASGDDARVVLLHGDVTEQMISHVMLHMLSLASMNHRPITLVISTYGGSVDEMFGLYDLIKMLPCPVHTVALGKVMSAGVLLLAAGTKGKRSIGRSARIMMHPISNGMGVNNVFDIKNETTELERMQKMMGDAMVRETKMTSKSITDIMENVHNRYIDAAEAIKLGIVDQILNEDRKK